MFNSAKLLLSPTQLLEKFSGAIATRRADEKFRRDYENSVRQARMDCVTNMFIKLCRNKIANMEAEDAIRIANGDTARPVPLNDAAQRDYDLILKQKVSDQVLSIVNDNLRELGWNLTMGFGEPYVRGGRRYIRDLLLLSPIAK
jgi:hypothetical protein